MYSQKPINTNFIVRNVSCIVTLTRVLRESTNVFIAPANFIMYYDEDYISTSRCGRDEDLDEIKKKCRGEKDRRRKISYLPNSPSPFFSKIDCVVALACS